MIKLLDNLSGVELKFKQFLIAVVDVLDVLLVFNLKLVEVNKLEVFAHLILVFDLALSLQDLNLV